MTAPTPRRRGPVLVALGALAIAAFLVTAALLGSQRSPRATPVAQASPDASVFATTAPTEPTPVPTSNPLAGALDPTFMAGLGTPGYTFVATNLPAQPAASHANFAVDSTGLVYVEVVAGYATRTATSDTWIRLVRYATDGPDDTFAAIQYDRQEDTANAAIGPFLGVDGVVIGIDTFVAGSIFKRYLATGAPDLSFASNGLTGTVVPGLGRGFVPLVTDAISGADGSILACAYDNLSLAAASFRLVEMTRLGATARADALAIPTCQALTIDTSNRMVLAGQSDLAVSTSYVGFERLLITRVVDDTFGVHGVAKLTISDTKPIRRGLLAMPDGSLIVGMNTLNDSGAPIEAVIARLTSAGVPDPRFGTAGVLRLTSGADCRLAAIAAQPDGRILAATTCVTGTTTTSELIRLLPDGTGDPTFGTDGHRIVNEPIAAMTVLPTDELLGVSILDDGRVSLWRRLL